MAESSGSMNEDHPSPEITTVIEGTPAATTPPGASSAHQYTYLQQQQLAQQAFARQLQTSQHAEPIGIPGQLATPLSTASSSAGASTGTQYYDAFGGSSTGYAGSSSVAPPRAGSSHNLRSLHNSSFTNGPGPLPVTSSYFSPSSASNMAPHTNLPSSVSSSYKSAAPQGSLSSLSSFPHQGSFVAQPFMANSSLPDRSSYYSQSFPRPPDSGFISDGMTHSPSASPPIGDASSSFAGRPLPAAHARTSLLTSKLAGAGLAGTVGHVGVDVPGAGVLSTSPSPSKSSFSRQPMYPYPNPRISSRHNSLTDPYNFATSGPSNQQQQQKFGTPSSFRQSFMPRPSSTTTNLSMAVATSSAPSSASSHDGFEAPNHSTNPPDEAAAEHGMHSPMDTDEPDQTQRGFQPIPAQAPSIPSFQHHNSYQGPNQERRHSSLSGPVPPPLGSRVSVQAPQQQHLDIANHPVPEVLVMLTALLQKIIDANDALHPQNFPPPEQPDSSEGLKANVLAFHGRNIPAISLHAYLSRVLKYCPTTNEVFISLLVYFDRIAQRANSNELSPSGVMSGEDERAESSNDGRRTAPEQLFVMDSYNIHRLIIAGVTVGSKFFSDIFYKNSRYAKVGGLPVDELNHLELQFLLLTDFRLMITLEELQRYGDLLLRFWQKESQGQES